MASKKTFEVFNNREITIKRTLASLRDILAAERKMEIVRKEFNDKIEEDVDYDGTLLIDVELNILDLQVEYLAKTLNLDVKTFEKYDPKEIRDFYSALYLFLSTKEDQLKETDGELPEKMLESAKQFEK